MTTPLFPENNGQILIKQGSIGDCYLLASLDCIFNSGRLGYEKIKSLFTEVPEGVIVRLRHNNLSVNLNPALLAGKYEYHYDKARNEDVFFISRVRLDEIDTATDGVETNSLAVKILEHLSSYYYVSNTTSSRRRTSTSAHNALVRYNGSSTIFVAKLLGLYAHDQHDFDEIIKIKMICPDQPIYISMWPHGGVFRHALRIEKIIPDQDRPGEYSFVLVNPWDNQSREVYYLADLRRRHCHFSVFVLEPQKYGLIRMLLKSAEALGRIVFADPELQQMVLRIQTLLGPSFSQQDIEYCVSLYQENGQIPGIFNRLNAFEQQSLVSEMYAAKNKLNHTARLSVMNFFAIYTEQMLNPEFYTYNVDLAILYTEIGIRKINMVSVSFVGIPTIQGIDEHCIKLVEQLYTQVKFDPGLVAADYLLGDTPGVASQHPLVVKALEEKTQEIYALAERHRSDLFKARAARDYYGLFTLPSGYDLKSFELLWEPQGSRQGMCS